MENILITDRLDLFAASIPCGNMRGLSINAQRYVVVHSKNDRWYLVKEECPHAGAKLQAGAVNDQHELVCPMHAYAFSLYDGREARGRCADLWVVKLWVSGNELWWKD
jgi:nitrite reductase/ring-hydroxylating ferredoxin subunit